MTTGRNGIRGLAALACLAAFCLGPARILPLFFALAAGIEGSHTVRLEAGGDGETKVVLCHEAAGAAQANHTPAHQTPAGLHHHGPASQVLCLLAGSANGEQDHVACFNSGVVVQDGSKGLRVQTRCAVSKQAQSMAAFGLADLGFPSSTTARASAAVVTHSNPWLQSARQRCLRSTCLLI